MRTTLESAHYEPRTLQQSLAERCRRMVDLARAAGADEAEAFASARHGSSVKYEKGDLKLVSSDEGAVVGLRVFKDKRAGFASTNQSDDSALEACVRDALATAAFAPAHEANVLPDARPWVERVACSREMAEADGELLLELGADLVRTTREKSAKFSLDGASADLSRGVQAVANSRGVLAHESDGLVSLSLMGMAIDGDEVGGFHYDSGAWRSLAAARAAARPMVEGVVDICLANLGARAATSYKGPVLFSADAFVDLFVAPLVAGSSALAVQRGRSPLAKLLGQAVASPLFTLRDAPHDLDLAGAAAFDREGVPTAAFDLVRAGVLQGWLHNAHSAAVGGTTSTGHARGGARGVPGLGPHALVVEAGEGGDESAMARALGRGLWVERFSGTVDPTNGDFSGVAKSSRWVDGGSASHAVKETMISGNALHLLRQIARVGSVHTLLGGAAKAPMVLVDGVDVTAG
jgi:PmbA protein